MENDNNSNDDAYDFGVFDIDPETESAVDPEPVPLHTVYHRPPGSFIIPPPLSDNSYYFKPYFFEDRDINPKNGQLHQTQDSGLETMIRTYSCAQRPL